MLQTFKIKLLDFLKRNMPIAIDIARSVKKYFKQKQLNKLRAKGDIITKEKLLTDLKKLNLKSSDHLIVHSSLSHMGYIEGGALTVVDCLLEIVKNGTLVMPSFAHQTFSKYYLDSDPIFDLKNSPSKAGAITEEFRKRKGVLRSLHPTDAVCAFGSEALYFTKDHFDQLTPYNQQSPYYRLAEKKGKILNIGVPLNTSCTNLHTLEDAVDFKYPIYHSTVYETKLIDENGNFKMMKTKVHDPAFSTKRRPDELIPLFEREGILTHGMVGKAHSTLIEAKGLLDVMMKHYKLNGITMYTPHGGELNT